MPRKIRQLEADLQHAGCIRIPAKGSHRKWQFAGHCITMSGKPGADAKPFQEKEVREMLSYIKNQRN
jgi:predicted RNA binding protein YcfA (HicA-like mRNA interferase family)